MFRKISLAALAATTAVTLSHAAGAADINAQARAAVAQDNGLSSTPLGAHVTTITTPTPTVTVTQTPTTVTTLGQDGGATTTTTTTTTHERVYSLGGYDRAHAGQLTQDEFDAAIAARWAPAGHAWLAPGDWTEVTASYRPAPATLHDFAYWDKNGDGRLDAGEISAMLAQTGLYAAWDTNHDGIVDAREYALGLFRLADANGDGVIDKQEWLNFQP